MCSIWKRLILRNPEVKRKWPQFNIYCVQFQILDVTQTEKDASGKCQVSYKSLDPHTFLKTKTDCISGKTVPFILHPDKVSALWPEWRIYAKIQGTGLYSNIKFSGYRFYIKSHAP
jgi:hypothetical protein